MIRKADKRLVQDFLLETGINKSAKEQPRYTYCDAVYNLNEANERVKMYRVRFMSLRHLDIILEVAKLRNYKVYVRLELNSVSVIIPAWPIV